jgi:probable addiction module antidote protein
MLKQDLTKSYPETFALFEIADRLDSEEMIESYLNGAAEDPNPEIFIAALDDVAIARTITQIIKEAGMSRENLYKSLRSSDSKLRFETITAVLHAIGVKFVFSPENPVS